MKNIFKLGIFFLIVCTVFASKERDQLFTEVEITLNNALVSSADILCPDDYQSAVEHYNTAVELFKENGSAGNIRNELELSISALTKLNDKLERNTDVFNSVLDVRGSAINSGADKYAGSIWRECEEDFADAVAELNDENLSEAISRLPRLEKNYNTAEQYGRKATTLIFSWKPLINANNLLADLISPDLYSAGMQYFSDALNGISEGEDEKAVNDNILEAGRLFDLAAANAAEFAQKYPELMKARSEAEQASAGKYAVGEWLEANQTLTETAELFNDDDFGEAYNYSETARYQFISAKELALKNHMLFDAKDQIAIAEKEGAENYAPITFEKSKTHFSMATSLIDNKSGNDEQILQMTKQAALEAQNALMITTTLKKIDEEELTWENVILDWEILDKVEKPARQEPDAGEKNKDAGVILSDAVRLFSEADAEEAFIYAPVTYKKGKALLDLALNIQQKNSYDPYELKSLALRASAQAQKSMTITRLVKDINIGGKTGEQVILDWNVLPELDRPEYEPVVKSEETPVEIPQETDYSKQPVIPPNSNIFAMFDSDEAAIIENPTGYTIRLTGLTFSSLSSVIKDEDKMLLNKTIEALKLYPRSDIQIIGHTDNVGIKSKNQEISLGRAESVKKYILQNSSISPSSITAEGKGESEPIADNRTFEGRRKNRRIEIVISTRR